MIKLKLSNFLLGKNKCQISWPISIDFVLKEEEEYRNIINDYDEEFEQKNKLVENIYNNKGILKKIYQKSIISENNEVEYNGNSYAKFLKWTNNSCQYDIFFFLFYYIIKPYIDDHNIVINNEIFNMLFNISDLCLKKMKILLIKEYGI